MIVGVEGLDKVLGNLKTAESLVHKALVGTVAEICVKGETGAKEILDQVYNAVDTGALKASIKGKVTNDGMDTIEGKISAGSSDVIRGTGEFEYSKKTGMKRDPQPTSEYAANVEFGGGYSNYGARPFMQTTYNWLKSEFPKLLTQSLRTAIKRIGI